MSKVGLIGVGAIGKGVLKNLVKSGCEVAAYDTSEKGKKEIHHAGVVAASHPKEVFQFADAVFLSLPGPRVIKNLLLELEKLPGELLKNKYILDLSTIDPSTTKDMAELCNRYDSYYFDCPVSGGPAGADAGALTIMVGGPEEEYSSIRPYLNYVGSNIEYIGATGKAQALKLCHNMLCAANVAALGESFATGVKHGLSVDVMADVIGKSIGNSRSLEYFGPNIVNDTYENVKFMLKHMNKDLGLYMQMAQQVGVPSFIGASAFNLYQTAIANGKGNLDHTAVCQVIEDLSSVKLTSVKRQLFNLPSADKKAAVSKRIGLIGVGAIGKGVLKNLLKNGCEVTAYDISEKGKEDIRSAGASCAAHPKEVFQFADAVFLSLPGPQIIRELFSGPDRVPEALLNDKYILDLSTIDPATTKEMADICLGFNSHYFDCPVSGGPAGADAGTLTIMVGGPEQEYSSILPYLSYVGSNIEYIGATGLAQALKLCHNTIVAVNIAAIGESFATGVKHGLSIDVMADVIGKSMGNTRALEYFGPNIVNDTYGNVKFMLNHMHKDLELYIRMTQQSGVPSFVGTSAYNLYHAAKAQGKGHLDHTAVCQTIEDLSSVKLVENFVASAPA